MAKIALLTTFMKFDPWYSLTSVVADQCRMLSKYGHEVHIIVNEKYSRTEGEFPFPNVTVQPILPFAHLYDYQSGEPMKEDHQKTVLDTSNMLVKFCKEQEIEFVFTHDIIFTGWNEPYALGIQKATRFLEDVVWLHWVHSIPSGYKSWWNMADYGPGHKIVYPNKTDLVRVAENYKATTQAVRIIPHIKDLRVMFKFSEEACGVIDDIPALMQADIVQIYPASSDRFEAKGLSKVIKIFGYIKAMGNSVCLFIANQWATTPSHRDSIQKYLDLAKKCGLEPGKDIVFSSFLTDYPFKVGVPSSILFELMQLSNLFIFPTDHETFGLVLPEVSLASGAMCVLNKSLQMMFEVGGGRTLYFDFGSYTHGFNPNDEDKYYREVAAIVVGRMNENDGIMTRTFMRQRYNYDSLYARYYLPVMSEAGIWR